MDVQCSISPGHFLYCTQTFTTWGLTAKGFYWGHLHASQSWNDADTQPSHIRLESHHCLYCYACKRRRRTEKHVLEQKRRIMNTEQQGTGKQHTSTKTAAKSSLKWQESCQHRSATNRVYRTENTTEVKGTFSHADYEYIIYKNKHGPEIINLIWGPLSSVKTFSAVQFPF